MNILLTLLGLLARHALTLIAGIEIGRVYNMSVLDVASAVDAALIAAIAVLWSCSQKNRQEK
jgi:membrane protein DedA with SNARE-associated domain